MGFMGQVLEDPAFMTVSRYVHSHLEWGGYVMNTNVIIRDVV
jgi:hypothetical protein